MMHSRNARHDVTLGWWEECDSNAGKLQQVACACYPFRRLQLQAMGVTGAYVESDAMSNQFLKLAADEALQAHRDGHYREAISAISKDSVVRGTSPGLALAASSHSVRGSRTMIRPAGLAGFRCNAFTTAS
eukprot:364029-Chlamydomonas_euryale.AAC.2